MLTAPTLSPLAALSHPTPAAFPRRNATHRASFAPLFPPQADGLDVLRAVAELVGVARPAGLSGIERAFLRLLAAAGAAGVALDKRFAFR